MHWIERFDLFLLDLDGLLVDTEALHYEAYKTLCARYDYELPWTFYEYLHVAHGSADGLKKTIYPHLREKVNDWDALYQEKSKIYMQLLESGKLSLMPGVEGFLEELSWGRFKRCVATHSSKAMIEIIKHSLPILKTIPVWISREDYEDPKPAPDAYLKAMELLADPGDQVIGFEDSVRGIQALQGANAFPILICDPVHPQLKEDALVDIKHFPTIQSIPNSFKNR